jgi:hypothetical protein
LKTQTPSRTPAKSKNLKYWRERGPEDVAYQRQAQITWWSVLGGIAIGILVTQISPVIEALKSPTWYQGLYFLATLLAIDYFWVSVSWGSLVLKWPITILSSLGLLLGNVAVAYASLNLNNPPVWMAALTALAFSALFNQLNFFFAGGRDAFPPEIFHGFRTPLIVYGGLVVVLLGFTIHMFLVPTQTVFLVYGFISILASIGMLVWQHQGMVVEKRELGIP